MKRWIAHGVFITVRGDTHTRNMRASHANLLVIPKKELGTQRLVVREDSSGTSLDHPRWPLGMHLPALQKRGKGEPCVVSSSSPSPSPSPASPRLRRATRFTIQLPYTSSRIRPTLRPASGPATSSSAPSTARKRLEAVGEWGNGTGGKCAEGGGGLGRGRGGAGAPRPARLLRLPPLPPLHPRLRPLPRSPTASFEPIFKTCLTVDGLPRTSLWSTKRTGT